MSGVTYKELQKTIQKNALKKKAKKRKCSCLVLKPLCCFVFLIIISLILLLISINYEKNVIDLNNKKKHNHIITNNEDFELVFYDEKDNTITYNFKFRLEKSLGKEIIYPSIISSDTIINYFNLDDILFFDVCCTTKDGVKYCDNTNHDNENIKIYITSLNNLINNQQTILLENIENNVKLLNKLKSEEENEIYLIIKIFEESLGDNDCWFKCEIKK